MTQEQFEKRLDKLLLTAAKDGLCGGCVCLQLINAASAIIREADHDALIQHGIGAVILPGTQSPDSTRH